MDGGSKMAEYTISSANLNAIERSLSNISQDMGMLNNNLVVVDSNVNNVNSNVKIVYDEIEALAHEFHDFVQIQVRANAKSNSQSRLIQIRQELEKRFGHYDIVRRTTTGILQADDLALVRRNTISTSFRTTCFRSPTRRTPPFPDRSS